VNLLNVPLIVSKDQAFRCLPNVGKVTFLLTPFLRVLVTVPTSTLVLLRSKKKLMKWFSIAVKSGVPEFIPRTIHFFTLPLGEA
jgi:hypothetical protein